MSLNYTVPPFQFVIGSFDASQYLDSISLSVPMHEPGQALLWTGRFKIANNLRAQLNNLTHDDFSEYATPSRWRPYQQSVRLYIKGYPSPIFRIEHYRYNPQTGLGEGILTQIPTAMAGDRPGQTLPTVVGGNIGTAIYNLLHATFARSTMTLPGLTLQLNPTIHPGYNIAGDSGTLDVPLSTRNPWSDALRLSSLSWHWLAVDSSEQIVSVDGSVDDSAGAAIFSRTLQQVEIAPDLAAIFQEASTVIVTGARQVEDKSQSQSQNPTAPRPKFKTTTEYRPAGAVFPSLGSDTTPTLFEEKTIIYQYWDDDGFSGYLPLFSDPLTQFLYDIQTQTETGIDPYKPPTDLNTALQTITIKRQPKGYLFSGLGASTTLVDAEVIVESNIRKLTIKPLGVIFPTLAPDVTLQIEKRETLTSEFIPPWAQLHPSGVDNNGKVQQYEARPKLEPPQPVATKPLKTETLMGYARLSPLNWTPVFAKPLVVDFGFLPDNARATFLASKIAKREQYRRDQALVDLPIPTEWLAAGWPLLARCTIAGNTYLMDGIAISIADREAKFGFTGGLVAGSTNVLVNGVPTTVPQPLFTIGVDLTASLITEAITTKAVSPINLTPAMIFEAIVTHN